MHIWIQIRDPTKETDADLYIKPVSHRDRSSQYEILSLHLWWLRNIIECRYIEIDERQKSVTQRNILNSVDWNHLVMISDINVSALFSIRVPEDYKGQLPSVMWIRELIKVLRLAARGDCYGWEWVLAMFVMVDREAIARNSSERLLIDCFIQHEQLNELTCTVLKKWNYLGFLYIQFLTPCISVGLSLFISFQHPETNPSNFQICWRTFL